MQSLAAIILELNKMYSTFNVIVSLYVHYLLRINTSQVLNENDVTNQLWQETVEFLIWIKL
jgi:hypothetical protein